MERMEGVGYFCVFLCEHVGMLAIGALPNSCRGIESLLGDSSLTCVCSLLFRFGPEMGAYSIYFSFCGWCCLPINVWLSLSDFHLFVLVVLPIFFLSLFFCYLLHYVCIYNVWLPLSSEGSACLYLSPYFSILLAFSMRNAKAL